MERPRRRGIGKTLPVGWMYMRPPDAGLKARLLEHIKNRRQKEEQECRERAARAKERKNEEEKEAYNKKQIASLQAKIEEINARRKEMDDTKDHLFAQLKEILMKADGNKGIQDEGLLKQLMQTHSKEKQEPPEGVTQNPLSVSAVGASPRGR